MVFRRGTSLERNIIVSGRKNETTRFKKTINNIVDQIETEAEVEHACVAALSDEQIDDPVHKKPLEDDWTNYSNDSEVMVKIARSKITDLIAEEVDRIYVKSTQADVQDQIEETLVVMLQLGNIAASNRIETASALFLNTIIIELFSRRAVDEVLSECLERWTQSKTYMNALVERIVCTPVLMRLVTGFI